MSPGPIRFGHQATVSSADGPGSRLGWPVPALPTTCVCGRPLEIDHALSCPHGGLPIRRHNEVRNLLASCMKAAGFDTAIEPPLQQLTGEQFVRSTTTTDQEARLDIKAAGFWGDGAEEAFFDVRVFNRFAPSGIALSPCQARSSHRLDGSNESPFLFAKFRF